MAKYQLLRHTCADVVDVKVAALPADRRVKDHLQQQIAELFLEVGRVAGFVRVLDGVKCFVRLFKQILGERGVGLLKVPRAASGSTEALHHGD